MKFLGPTDWEPCFASPARGVAFFDGVFIEADPIMEPRWDRVLPIMEEEQIFMCRQMRPLLEDLVRRNPDALVLDVGTGSGVFAIWAAKLGCRVVAIDVSSRALRMARLNAAKNRVAVTHNEDLSSLAPETVLLQQCDLDRCCASLPGHFDVVFLSPAYNPTCERLIPAQHAAYAGPKGQDCFVDQINRVPSLLRAGGYCLGNQLTPCEDQQLEALVEIERAFKGRYIGLYTHILGPSGPDRDLPSHRRKQYPARDFLSEQYRTYLDPHSTREPAPDQVRRYVAKLSAEFSHYALIYYAVQLTDAAEDSGLTEYTSVEVRGKSWSDRTWLHRQIVDHTSTHNAFPSPALFMADSPVAPLPRIAADTDRLRDQDPPDRYDTSVLRAVDNWLQMVGLVGNKAGTEPRFSLLFLDTAPWYRTAAGVQSLPEECKLWFANDNVTDPPANQCRAIIEEWQRNTLIQQDARVGPYLHPHFVGIDSPGHWSDVALTYLEGNPKAEIREEDGPLWAQIQSALRAAEAKQVERSTAPRFEVDDANGYGWTTLHELKVPDPDEIWAAVKEHARAAGGSSNGDETAARHLQLCHLAMHDRLHRELGRVLQSFGHPAPKWSVLAGVPLRLAFSSGQEAEDVLSSYRGGIWLFAVGTDDWTKQHEQRFLDTLRLAWLLYDGRYNMEATVHAAQLQTAATLAKYARGASHSLKNAVALPLWRMAGAQELLTVFTKGGWSKKLERKRLATEAQVIGDLLNRAALVESDIEFLRRQTETMFWIMDPSRMRKELLTDPEQVLWDADSINKLVSLSCAAAVRKLSRHELGLSSERQKQEMTQRVLSPVQNSASLPELGPALSLAVGDRVRCTITAVPTYLTKVDYRVAENITFELVVNAMARALSASRFGPSFFRLRLSSTRSGVRLTLLNTASWEDGRRLTENWDAEPTEETRRNASEDDSGSRGVSGLHQIQLLCSRAEAEKRYPTLSANSNQFPRTRLELLHPRIRRDKSAAGLCVVKTGLEISTLVE